MKTEIAKFIFSELKKFNGKDYEVTLGSTFNSVDDWSIEINPLNGFIGTNVLTKTAKFADLYDACMLITNTKNATVILV